MEFYYFSFFIIFCFVTLVQWNRLTARMDRYTHPKWSQRTLYMSEKLNVHFESVKSFKFSFKNFYFEERENIVATFRARELQFYSQNNGMAKLDHHQVACVLARCKVIRTNRNIRSSRLSWCTENKSERSIEMISQKSSISHLNCSFVIFAQKLNILKILFAKIANVVRCSLKLGSKKVIWTKTDAAKCVWWLVSDPLKPN